MPQKEEIVYQPIPIRKQLAAYWYFIQSMWRVNPALALVRALLVFGSAILQPLQVFVFSLLIVAIAAGKMSSAPLLLWASAITYGLQYLFQSLLDSPMDAWFARQTGLAAQQTIFESLAQLDPEMLLRKDIRRSLDYVREELWRLNNLVSHSELFARSLIRLVASLGLVLIAPWWVTLIVIADSFFQAMIFRLESKRDVWNSTWNSLDGRRVEYTRFLFLGGEEFRELRLLGAEGMFLQKFAAATRRVVSRFRDAALESTRNRTLVNILHAAGYAVVILVLGGQAFAAPAMLATLYVSINLFSLLGESFNGLSGSLSRLSSDVTVLSRIHDLVSLPGESSEGLTIPKEPLVVRFEHVSFRYPGSEKDALHDVTLELREGEHLAVVGENGAGKSTFLHLLSGLSRPTSGKILINGVPLHEYRHSEWRRAFHLMMQGAILYQDFIRDNLSYGVPPKKWKQYGFSLDRSAKIAGADAVIRDVTNGYGAFIGDWAAPPQIEAQQVSGGQKQKLLIARTLVHGGRIVGFDEPTSAMDALAETAFFERLHESMVGRGLIFISHRFSTVRRASRVIVFVDGRLTEDGTHEELLAKEGKYAQLYSEQAKWYA